VTDNDNSLLQMSTLMLVLTLDHKELFGSCGLEIFFKFLASLQQDTLVHIQRRLNRLHGTVDFDRRSLYRAHLSVSWRRT